jgi:hypothetical protein
MATLRRFATKRSCTIVTSKMYSGDMGSYHFERKGRGKTSSVETLEGVWSLIIRDT